MKQLSAQLCFVMFTHPLFFQFYLTRYEGLYTFVKMHRNLKPARYSNGIWYVLRIFEPHTRNSSLIQDIFFLKNIGKICKYKKCFLFKRITLMKCKTIWLAFCLIRIYLPLFSNCHALPPFPFRLLQQGYSKSHFSIQSFSSSFLCFTSILLKLFCWSRRCFEPSSALVTESTVYVTVSVLLWKLW